MVLGRGTGVTAKGFVPTWPRGRWRGQGATCDGLGMGLGSPGAIQGETLLESNHHLAGTVMLSAAMNGASIVLSVASVGISIHQSVRGRRDWRRLEAAAFKAYRQYVATSRRLLRERLHRATSEGSDGDK